MTYRDDAKAQYDVESGDPAQGYITADDDKAVVDILADEIDKKAALEDLYDAPPVEYRAASGYNAGSVVHYQHAYYVAKRDTSAGQSPSSSPGGWLALSLDAVATKAQHALVPADAKDQVPFGIKVTRPNGDDILTEVWDASAPGGGKWHTVHYDSGWRDIMALIDPAWVEHNSNTHPRIRRINDTVIFAGIANAAADMSAVQGTLLDTGQMVGFRTSGVGLPYVAFGTVFLQQGVLGALGNTSNAGHVEIIGLSREALPIGRYVSVNGRWETSDPIPTTLPGTKITYAPEDEPDTDLPPDTATVQ